MDEEYCSIMTGVIDCSAGRERSGSGMLGTRGTSQRSCGFCIKGRCTSSLWKIPTQTKASRQLNKHISETSGGSMCFPVIQSGLDKNSHQLYSFTIALKHFSYIYYLKSSKSNKGCFQITFPRQRNPLTSVPKHISKQKFLILPCRSWQTVVVFLILNVLIQKSVYHERLAGPNSQRPWTHQRTPPTTPSSTWVPEKMLIDLNLCCFAFIAHDWLLFCALSPTFIPKERRIRLTAKVLNKTEVVFNQFFSFQELFVVDEGF